MPTAVGWWEMVGRATEVMSGPYVGLKGVVQESHGETVVLGYLDRNRQPRTITVEADCVKMPIREGEELRR